MSTKSDKGVATGCFPMKNPFGSKKDPGSFDEKTRSLRLDDKVAVITGAASGIGAATARLFVSEGARVILADVQAEAGKKLSSELGSSAHFFFCDVTKEADVAAAVDYAVQCWGHLDIMFNNAGVQGPLAGLAEINMEEFDQVMAVHIKGAVLGVKHAARVMIPAGKGVILFSGSTSANMGGAGPPLHSAANAAVLCIARSAAAEFVRHGIRVNAVSPHCVATPLSLDTINASLNSGKDITVKQLDEVLAASSELDALTTEKVASAVMFLASDDAGFISGHNLVLDGGFSVTKPFALSELKAALQKSPAAPDKSKAQSPVRSPIRSLEGSGTSKLSTASIAKEREMGDKLRVEEVKRSYEREREKRKEDREEKEREVEEKKVPAKEEKTRAKEARDPTTQATKGDIHPLDKKASAKEERMQNENIELPNAGPEPDIPLEYQSRPPVKKISSLFSPWRKESKKEGKTEDKSTDPEKVSRKGIDTGKGKMDDRSNDPGKVSKTDEKKGKSTDPESVSQSEAKSHAKEEFTPESQPKESPVKRIGSLFGLGKDSTKEDKEENKGDDPGKVSKQEKQKEKAADPRKANSPATAEKAQPKHKSDSPKTLASPEIIPESQSKQSPVKRIGILLGLGKDSTKEDKKENKSDDPGKVSKQEKQEETSADLRKANSPAIAEKAQPKHKSDSPKTPASPEIIPESQSKQSPVKRIGILFGLGKDSTKENKRENKGDDPGKVSKKEKQEEQSADPRKANSPAIAEKAQPKHKSEPPKTAAFPEITPESQSKQSPVKGIGSLLGLGKDSTKEDKMENKSDDLGKVSIEEKQEGKSANTRNVSKKESNSSAKEEKPRPKRKNSPKTPPSPAITLGPQPTQSLLQRIGSLLGLGKDSKKQSKKVSWGKDTEKKDNQTDDKLKSLDTGKVSEEEKKEDKSADPIKVATKETKSPSKKEKAPLKDSTKTPASPEITPEPQPKQSPNITIGNLLNWGADKTKDVSANPGKVSKK